MPYISVPKHVRDLPWDTVEVGTAADGYKIIKTNYPEQVKNGGKEARKEGSG